MSKKMRNVVISLLCIVSFSLQAQSRADSLLSLLHDTSGNYVFVVAHRGDWRNAPENSLKAMERSIKMGVDMVEIDIRMTKDGELVLMHDGTIDRTTTGKGNVADYTLAELRQFYLKDGLGVVLTQQIPTLKEVMLLCKDKILVNVDKAADYMDKVQEILKETGTEKQVVYKGYKPYQDVKQQYGDLLNQIIYMPIVADNTKGLDTVVADFIKYYKPVAFEIIFRTEDSPMNAAVKAMKTNACRVWVNSLWANMNAGHNDERAVDEPDACWGWLIEYGASIIQTDRPKELIEYLKSKNKRISK
ncbi:glycerophosphoryl diester phosphodiesterase [Bacteroidia bacterium]|nr:glycerophosphoryl diester phosphodiesterase [Bacteroidia bacterium]